MASIKSLENKHVHSIQAGQVIVDLSSLVQELVENSLDAGATFIDVRFKDYGLKGIEVQDNGSGIEKENYTSIALKSHTSKTSSVYDNSYRDGTFGSRGDALSAICALAHLEIVTAQGHEVPRGARLSFDDQGRLLDTSITACEKGTVVKVTDLFNTLPVRRKEFEKNARRDYAKALALLQSYSCINTGMRFAVSNHVGKGKKTIAISTNLNSTIRDNIANIFGARRIQNLMDFNISLEEDNSSTAQQISQNRAKATSIEGFISKPSNESHHIFDRQLFYVNSRPCNLPQVSKTFNEIYKIFNLSNSPFVLANLLIGSEFYETRRLPGKTTVHLHDDCGLLETLKSSLSRLLKIQPFDFPKKSNSSQAPTLEHQILREPTTKTIRDNNSNSAEFHEGNYSVQHYNNDCLEMSNSAAHETAKSITECSVSDTESDLSASSSRISNREQIEQSYSREIASGQRRKLSNINITEANIELENYSHSDKRSKLETTRSDTTIAAQSTNLALKSQNKLLEPKNVTGIEHNKDSFTNSRGTKTTLAKVDHVDTETHDISAKIAFDGRDTELNKLENLVPDERTQTQSKTKEEKIGFVIAKNHSDILQLKSQYEEELQGRHGTANDVGESNQIDSQIDKDPEVEQAQGKVLSDITHSEEMVADERDYQAYQKSKVSSLIAAAEEAKAVCSRALRSRAIFTLNHVHTKEIMKPVRFLTSSLSWSEAYTKPFKKILYNDQSIAKNVVKEIEEKVHLMSLSKSEFANMRVIGQFNFGFVLAITKIQATATSAPDLFIIDQHASDEKYNFETFENTLSITSQRLAHPQRIELTAVEEELVLRYNDVLLKNGFKVAFEDAGSTGNGSQQRLVGLPSLGGVLYDKSDFQDLLNILNESNGTRIEHRFNLPRPTKTRKILAMKACRSSIMIGKSLSKGQMKQIILQLGQIDKPWHCPHGRPTIKYLSSLGKFQHWKEGDGVVGIATDGGPSIGTDWAAYLR